MTTVTLISNGFESTERIGLVLLLWPGVELALLAVKCELSRWGNGNRTMAEEANAWVRSGASWWKKQNLAEGRAKRNRNTRQQKWAQRIRVQELRLNGPWWLFGVVGQSSEGGFNLGGPQVADLRSA